MFFIQYMFKTCSTAAPAQPVVAKTEMNVIVKNPEIVFVADLSRADAPALVMTTQCELVMKSDAAGQFMTATITDLKVVACPFVHGEDESNITTVLQPCQVFFNQTQSPTQPQKIELSINSLTLKVKACPWKCLSDHFIFNFPSSNLRVFSLLGVTHHHKHSHHYPVSADPCSRDP